MKVDPPEDVLKKLKICFFTPPGLKKKKFKDGIFFYAQKTNFRKINNFISRS